MNFEGSASSRRACARNVAYVPLGSDPQQLKQLCRSGGGSIWRCWLALAFDGKRGRARTDLSGLLSVCLCRRSPAVLADV
jgi:hypothetical protein